MFSKQEMLKEMEFDPPFPIFDREIAKGKKKGLVRYVEHASALVKLFDLQLLSFVDVTCKFSCFCCS